MVPGSSGITAGSPSPFWGSSSSEGWTSPASSSSKSAESSGRTSTPSPHGRPLEGERQACEVVVEAAALAAPLGRRAADGEGVAYRHRRVDRRRDRDLARLPVDARAHLLRGGGAGPATEKPGPRRGRRAPGPPSRRRTGALPFLPRIILRQAHTSTLPRTPAPLATST